MSACESAECSLTVPHLHPKLITWASEHRRGAEEIHGAWLNWLADIGYGVDFTCTPPPPCTPQQLAEVYAKQDGEDPEDWIGTLLDGNTAGGWYGNGQDKP